MKTADLTKVTFSAKGIAMLALAILLVATIIAVVTPAGQAAGNAIVGAATSVKKGVLRENTEASAESNSPFPGTR